MASRKPTPSPEPTNYSDPYSDPLEMDEEDTAPATEQVAIPTGLADDEDARRYLQHRFGNVVWCPNCETVYDRNDGVFCPRCEDEIQLTDISNGAFSTRRKRHGA